MRNTILFSFILSLLFACTQQPADQEPVDQAQEIVDAAILAHGGDLFNHANISFTFRDRDYISSRRGGTFQYERIFTNPDDSLQQVRDILTNEAFSREINGKQVELVDTMASKYSNSVNSVIYFAVLPYGLNDAAVNKKYLGEVDMKGTPYHKIQVTFEQEGGGKDYDDVFLYYFRTDSYQMDYFGYLYHTDGGGIRFREAFNQREVSGILFSDYVNLKMDTSLDFMTVDSLFSAGLLQKLSLIELEDLEVEILSASSNE